MQIIQIRGNNASGKTTTVRQYVRRNNLEYKEVLVSGKGTFISTNKDSSIVVLGRYDKKTGGCDLFDNREHVFDTIKWVMANIKPKTIIFEGLIYGLTYKFASEIAEYAKTKGYEYKGICLYIEPQIALERLYKRNGGKSINEDAIYSKSKAMMSSYHRLKEAGYNVKIIDTGSLAESTMYRLLEGELNGQ